MNREKLESLSINDLRALAARLKIDTKGTRSNIFESIINYYEREGWSEQSHGQSSTESTHEPNSDPSTISSGSEPPGEKPEMSILQPPCMLHTAGSSSGVRTQNPTNISSLPDIQFIVESVVQALQQASSSSSANVPHQNTCDTREANGNSSNIWQRVKCAEKLIPTFSGKEDENVIRWLERIANIAQTYHFGSDVLLLAAISQLKERALNWYNRQPLESVSTWEEFKFQVRRYFERKESYTATLARISTRFWKSHTEKFIDYAEAKLNLMQSLKLSEKEKIELLADGVKDFNLRRMVLNTWIDNVPDFIEHVRKITEDSIIVRKGESKHPMKKTGETTSSTEKTCFTCKKTGHLSNTCPKKEANRSTSLNHVEKDASPPSTSSTDISIGQRIADRCKQRNKAMYYDS